MQKNGRYNGKPTIPILIIELSYGRAAIPVTAPLIPKIRHCINQENQADARK
jgi:hypothetical protein